MKKTYIVPEVEFIKFSQEIVATSPCSCDFCDNSIGIECVNCVYDE